MLGFICVSDSRILWGFSFLSWLSTVSSHSSRNLQALGAELTVSTQGASFFLVTQNILFSFKAMFCQKHYFIPLPSGQAKCESCLASQVTCFPFWGVQTCPVHGWSENPFSSGKTLLSALGKGLRNTFSSTLKLLCSSLLILIPRAGHCEEDLIKVTLACFQPAQKARVARGLKVLLFSKHEIQRQHLI